MVTFMQIEELCNKQVKGNTVNTLGSHCGSLARRFLGKIVNENKKIKAQKSVLWFAINKAFFLNFTVSVVTALWDTN